MNRVICLLLIISAFLTACGDSRTGTGPTELGAARPQMTYYAAPEYPPLAYQAELEGDVTVRVTVLASGEIQNPAVQASSGTTSLDESALVAAWRCLWQPASRHGRPIDAPAVYVVRFRLAE